MSDEWMMGLKVPMTFEQFLGLPRNSAYKYEYIDGTAWLSPRPKYYHAVLDLKRFAADTLQNAAANSVRPLRHEDWPDLTKIFSGAFAHRPPFDCLEDERRLQAASKSLERTRAGNDGPLIEQACLVALVKEDGLVGAIIVTLLPDQDPAHWDAFHWKEQPPKDWRTTGIGRPHLTWIFTSWWLMGRGIGTALLHAAARELHALGYTKLASTFALGNDSSLLWHWRNGFQLAPYPGSFRRMPLDSI